MDVLIRNVDPIAIKKLDESAKKKGISRQEFLKAILEKNAYDSELTDKDARVEMIITKNIQVMKESVNATNEIRKLLLELTDES